MVVENWMLWPLSFRWKALAHWLRTDAGRARGFSTSPAWPLRCWCVNWPTCSCTAYSLRQMHWFRRRAQGGNQRLGVAQAHGIMAEAAAVSSASLIPISRAISRAYFAVLAALVAW